MRKISILVLLLILTGCSTKQDKLYAKLSKDDKKIVEYKGHFKVTKEDVGRKEPLKAHKPEHGIASWYGQKKLIGHSFHGKKTANGDKFNTDTLTAAHKTLPIPSIAKVTNLENNKSLIVMINDRGPYTKSRIIDVSSKAAHHLGFKNQGIAKVKVEPLHEETKELLNKLSLKPEHGKKPHGKIKEPKCTINCHVKLMNIKHGIKVD